MTKKIQFDDSRARSYRKLLEVLAFRSDDPICFRKTWGEQDIRKAGWVIVPLSDTGEPTNDIYGIDAEVFASSIGISGLRSVSGDGSSRRMAEITPEDDVPTNGRLPIASSKSKMPREKMSVRWSTVLPSACSGDM